MSQQPSGENGNPAVRSAPAVPDCGSKRQNVKDGSPAVPNCGSKRQDAEDGALTVPDCGSRRQEEDGGKKAPAAQATPSTSSASDHPSSEEQ